MVKKYNIIYSIGEDCGCAMNLQFNNLRLSSGPFDWLTHATFEKRFELMLNDFKDFFNYEDFVFLNKDPNAENDDKNDYYNNTNTGFYFYHDFTIGVPFDEIFPEVKAKYERRIKRFYENIINNKKVLLVWFSRSKDTPNELIVKCANELCKKFNKKIDFLIIENNHLNNNEIEKQILQDNIVKYKVSTQHVNPKELVCGNQENVRKIFKQYSIKIKTSVMIDKKLRNFISRFICCFIPIKQWRHVVRDKIKKTER